MAVQLITKKFIKPVGLSTKYAANLIGDRHASVLLNSHLDNWERRGGARRIIGPPSKSRYLFEHIDMRSNRYFLSWCENGEVYYTEDLATWTQLLNGGVALGLSQNYLPWACTFMGDCYGVNGYNGMIKFTGSSAIEVVNAPSCAIVAGGDGRLIAIALTAKPYAIKFSAFLDAGRWAGSENAAGIYGKIAESAIDQLPKVDYYEFNIGDGEPINGYWKFRKAHVFTKERSICVGYKGADPLGQIQSDERFEWFELTRQVGCLSGRTICEQDGWLVWRGYDGQMYGWDGSVKGPAGTDQFGISIFCLTDPLELDLPNIGDLMDHAKLGYTKPDYSVGTVGPDTQSEWASGTVKTNVDTATSPGNLQASKDSSGIVKKENYEPVTLDGPAPLYSRRPTPPGNPYWNCKVEAGHRFKCSEAGNRVYLEFKVNIDAGLVVSGHAYIYACSSDGIPDITRKMAQGGWTVTGTGAAQMVGCVLQPLSPLVLDEIYEISIGIDTPPYCGAWSDPWYNINLLYEATGGDPDPQAGAFAYTEYNNGYRTWHSWIGSDMWYRLYAGSLVYQSSSVWFKDHNKGDVLAPWGVFAVNPGTPQYTTLAYKILCKSVPVLNTDTLVAVTNGEAINQAKFGGDVAANVHIGIRVEGGTTTPWTNTWLVDSIKASFIKGAAATALAQAVVWRQTLYMLAKESTLVNPWNPSGIAATVNNVIVVRHRGGGFHLWRGFKGDLTKQEDFSFQALALFNGKLYGALANALTGMVTVISTTPTVGGADYTAGDILLITTGGAGCRVTVATVDANGAVTALTATPVSEGVGYTTGAGKTTSGGTGAGCTVNITTVVTDTYRMAELDYDQEYDLVNDDEHKIYSWCRLRNEDLGKPNDFKIWLAARYTREELGSDLPFQAKYALDQGAFCLLGYRTDEGSGTILTLETLAQGLGYAVGDVVYVDDGTNGYLAITSVGSSGEVTGFEMLYAGSGYTAAAHNTTNVVGTGTGFTVTVLTVLDTTTDKIYAASTTLGLANSMFHTLSGAWGRMIGGVLYLNEDRLYYPNFERLEYPASSQKTMGFRIWNEFMTTRKIKMQSVEVQALVIESDQGMSGDQVPIPLEGLN